MHFCSNAVPASPSAGGWNRRISFGTNVCRSGRNGGCLADSVMRSTARCQTRAASHGEGEFAGSSSAYRPVGRFLLRKGSSVETGRAPENASAPLNSLPKPLTRAVESSSSEPPKGVGRLPPESAEDLARWLYFLS